MGQDQSRDGGSSVSTQLEKEIAAQTRINRVQEELNLANQQKHDLENELQLAKNQSQASLSMLQAYQATERSIEREAALLGNQNKDMEAQLAKQKQVTDDLLAKHELELIQAKEEANAHKEQLQILLEYQDKLQQALDKAILSQTQASAPAPAPAPSAEEQTQAPAPAPAEEQTQAPTQVQGQVECRIIIHQRMDGSSAKELYIPDWRVAFFKSGSSIELIDDYDGSEGNSVVVDASNVTVLYNALQKFIESRDAFLNANSIFDKITDLIEKL